MLIYAVEMLVVDFSLLSPPTSSVKKYLTQRAPYSYHKNREERLRLCNTLSVLFEERGQNRGPKKVEWSL